MPYKDPADQKAAAQRHYQANRDKIIARTKAFQKVNREVIRVWVQKAKSVPCADCKERHPYYVMQFDHVGTDKEFNLGQFGHRSLDKVKAEVAKCEVVCANCHAKRTHARRVAEAGFEPATYSL